MLDVTPYPELDLRGFTAVFPSPLAELLSPEWLTDSLRLDAPAPMRRSEEVRAAVRDLLRQRGYKPTGRGKPASEYLVRAAEEGALRSINAVVDACNVVSLHSGLPISVVDLDRVSPPLRVETAPLDARYIFNPSGQEIDVGGLPCLFDAEGPCANAVKDSQRTKTGPETRRALALIWGSTRLPGRADAACRWYMELLSRAGAAASVLP